jgi:tetratricopeptide (TPR) repeat protein
VNPGAGENARLMQSGDMQYEEKRYAEAEKTYRNVLERDAKDREAWSSLGMALRQQGKHGEAAEAFTRSAGAEGGHMTGWSYFNAASEYAQAGQKENAIRMLEKAFENGYKGDIAGDPNFASIASEPKVKQLLATK